MSERWFEEWALRWTQGVNLTSNQLKKIAALLRQLAEMQAAGLVEDFPATEEQARNHVERRLEDLFQRWFGRYAGALRRVPGPSWRMPRTNAAPDFPFVRPVQTLPRLNLNSATLEDLVALPLVGRVTAAAILRARMARGSFRHIHELDQVPGIGPTTLALLKERCHCGPTQEAVLALPGLAPFLERPSLASYVRLMALSGGQWLPPERSVHGTPGEHILKELTALRDEVAAAPYPRYTLLGASRASEVVAVEKSSNQLAAALETSQSAMACLLADREYLPFVGNLLNNALSSIDLMMFYLKIEPRNDYPVNALLDKLVAKHGQGVAVRVILDRDHPTDVYRSEVINREALLRLQRAGVPVRQDERTRLTHAKLLLMDGRHIVLGSHNWTAGSLCLYGETSVYLNSAPLAADFYSLFQDCWDAAEAT